MIKSIFHFLLYPFIMVILLLLYVISFVFQLQFKDTIFDIIVSYNDEIFFK